ncbi:hypothetical protein [Winogradskyella arenosi]|uniref:Uncharacterized protein n=1 Tax=Winogradskyella arenosi TaxID=533325 RepID=A0A368ZKG4_9FLAO|nr:hypothetical protein [Winogradskyella arenosi]RCW93637.1 hypothetical protein DFQ08_101434 [Winogradskyella arenosi]
MIKKYKKEAFSIDPIPFNERKKDNTYNGNSFQLKNYENYEPKLENDFYIKYFIKELLFEIDILEVDDFLQYHFENCKNADLNLSVLELKIVPKTKDIIINAKAFLDVNNTYYNEILLEDGFIETEGIIKNSQYEYGQMLHFTGFNNLQNDLEQRLELILTFTTKSKETENENVLTWTGKPTHLAFIISQLLNNEYIDAPLKNDGEINYTELSKQIQNSFNFTNKTPSIETLRRYTNIESEKYYKLNDNFKEKGFYLPNSKMMG